METFDLQSRNFYIYHFKQQNEEHPQIDLIPVYCFSIGCSGHLVSAGNKQGWREVAKIVSVFSVVGKQVSISIDNSEQGNGMSPATIQH